MSTFLSKEDYRASIKSYRFDQLLADEEYSPEDVMDDAESEAIATVKDALFGYYDVDTIFAATGTNRKKNVVNWVRCISLYYIFRRIPDDMVPDRVVKDYDDCMETLEKISDGKKNVDLPSLLDDEEAIITTRRWGSQTARSHGDE